VLDGQKVWSSGAQFSQWGEAICRTDPSVPKHAGQTAFLVPLDAPGVDVRPIRQITGGSSFNEVFLTGVRIPDSLRLGDVGAGWKVALTTLGFERATSGSHSTVGGTWPQVLALARSMGRAGDPVVRQRLAHLYSVDRARTWARARVSSGPAGSIGKLAWTEWMREVSDVVSLLLGARLTADTGEGATFGWTKHVLGAPGYRIAGGSDEVQRNIIGERVLGLPAEPRVDRDVPFSQIPR
jgi:alkylation response protein AidB-like acyl-CoA dehydrogenase